MLYVGITATINFKIHIKNTIIQEKLKNKLIYSDI